MIVSGISRTSSAKMTENTIVTWSAIEMTFRTAATSRLPQYWEASTEAPPAIP